MPFSSLEDGDVSPTIASLLVADLRRCEGVVAAVVPPVAEEQWLPKSSCETKNESGKDTQQTARR